MFSANQSKIQAVLKLYGSSPPKLVDVNWRLDYQVEVFLFFFIIIIFLFTYFWGWINYKSIFFFFFFFCKTNTRGPVQQLIYFIDLILDDKGRRELLSFTASHAELEDLVNTLKDACQSVKRVALL